MLHLYSQAFLKSELDKQLQQGLIAGKHPQVLARDIRKAFNVSRSDAERLMRTELARVQTDAQMRSFEENGFEWYMFLSLGSGACEVCRALNGKKFKVKDMLISENAPPMHPNCRCSTAAAMGDEEIAEIRGGEKSGSTGTISSTSERERAYAYIQDDGKREPGHVNLPLVSTKKYHDKYDNLTRQKDVNESLYSESMKILRDRNNTEFEDIVAIDARTGDRLVKNCAAFANGVKHRCGFSRKEQNWLEGEEGRMRCCTTIQTIRFHLETIFISYLNEVSSLHQQYAAIMGTCIGLRN
ncbi:minor capsid protein [Hornefia porci]|uniref:minor capsid protein n=1 Tax=Hornefia porci TaxID=2652292 RepID=UPI001FE26630|nr:minor capsid protein [Hornefia porci]